MAKTGVTCLTHSCLSGSGGRSLSYGWPYRQTFVAADGRALLVYVYYSTVAGTVKLAFTQTNGTDKTSWAAETVIHTLNLGSTVNNSGCSGWMDSDDNIYVAYFGRQLANFLGFVKLTKAVGGGWTAGSYVTISTAIGADCISICKVPGTGRLWIASVINSGGNYFTYYSNNDGVNWTAGPTFGASINASGSPIFITAYDSTVIMVRKTTTPAIVGTVRDDTQAVTVWGSDSTIWSGSQANSTDTWQHSFYLLVVSHAYAKVLLVCRCSDATLRVKKYLGGWVAGDTTLGATVTTGYTRGIWAAEFNKLLAWPFMGSVSPILYDPTDNSTSGTAFDNTPTNPVGHNQGLGYWFAAYSSEASGTETLYFYYEALGVSALSLTAQLAVESGQGLEHCFTSPVEQLASVARLFEILYCTYPETTITIGFTAEVESLMTVCRSWSTPTEWDGCLVLQFFGSMPIEASGVLQAVATLPVEALQQVGVQFQPVIEALQKVAGAGPIPIEYAGALVIALAQQIQVEAGGGIGFPVAIPIEASGLILLAYCRVMRLDSYAKLISTWALPTEATGLDMALVDTWNVLNKLSEPFVDEWMVVPIVLKDESFVDSFNVKSISGDQFVDSWRIVPQSVVTLFSDDIQLPVGSAETQ